jgi:hypothetical protein
MITDLCAQLSIPPIDPPRGKISGEAVGLRMIAEYREVRSCNLLTVMPLSLFLTPSRLLLLMAGELMSK